MAAETYDAALDRLLLHEGGYANHPSDPGGPTNFGITIHDYRKYVKPDASAADVRTMKIADAKAIYREKYWDAMNCDALPAGVDYCLFDYGVNSGIGRAPKVLQRVVGVAADGRIGPVTLAAVHAHDAAAVVNALCDERLRFLQSLKTWPVFGRGWSRRVREVRAAALAMADQTQAVPKTNEAPSSVPGKGAVLASRAAPAGAAGAVAATGGAAVVQSSEPSTIIVILAVTIALALGAWFFWRWWQKRRQDAPIKIEWREE